MILLYEYLFLKDVSAPYISLLQLVYKNVFLRMNKYAFYGSKHLKATEVGDIEVRRSTRISKEQQAQRLRNAATTYTTICIHMSELTSSLGRGG